MCVNRRWLRYILLSVLLCGGCLPCASAQPAPAAPGQENYERLPFMTPPAEAPPESAPSAGGLLLRTVGALLLIVGLIVATAWALRRLNGTPLGGADSPAVELTLLGTLPLGDRRQLAAVRFGDQLLLIGSTAQALTLLAARTERPLSYTPPRRSVADLLAEEEPRNFARALTLADERLRQQSNIDAHDGMQPAGNDQ
ncbi:MAG: flagellar biosynthetic protein FliO [Acidobacteria bacterium]|nr:flagellar biosynthetic protein FliO [Acidobacteriota bacterium]MBI3426986.1 flagellar biosynthetic protein FliO [Acidobacteriota bacterium]